MLDPLRGGNQGGIVDHRLGVLVDRFFPLFNQSCHGFAFLPAKVRVAALIGLGRGFKSKKILDLAVLQFTTAKAELPAMDETKKSVVYELASCYEAMGKAEEAIAEFKLIYGEDIGYRDVGEKITAHYSK